MVLIAAGAVIWGLITLALLGFCVAMGVGIFRGLRAVDRRFFRKPVPAPVRISDPSAIVPDPPPEQPPGCAMWFLYAIGAVSWTILICIQVLRPGGLSLHLSHVLAVFMGAVLWSWVLTFFFSKPRERSKPASAVRYAVLSLVPLPLVMLWMDRTKSPMLPVMYLVGYVVGRYAAILQLLYYFSDRRLKGIRARGMEFGDPDGAIAELRAQIESGGPNWRNHDLLADLLIEQERWAEAYAEVQALEVLIGRIPEVASGLSLCLWKMGRPDEALAVAEESLKPYPHHIDLSLTIGRILTDLDRRMEARAWLVQSEELFRRLKIYGPGAKEYRQFRRNLLDKLRADLDAKGGLEKPKAEDLAEL